MLLSACAADAPSAGTSGSSGGGRSGPTLTVDTSQGDDDAAFRTVDDEDDEFFDACEGEGRGQALAVKKCLAAAGFRIAACVLSDGVFAV